MAFNINAHVILQGPKNISAVAKNIQTQLQNINVSIGVNIPKNVQNQINSLNKQLNNLNSTNQKVTSGARSAASSIQGIGNQAKQTSNAMQVLGKETALTFKRFAAAGLVTATFFKMTQAIGTAIPKALEFERGLVKLQQITGSTRKGLDKLKNSVNSLAKNFGKDANELLELSQIFAQTGQNLKQVEASVRAVARSSLAPTFGEMKQTAEGLVAALNQFGIAASDSEKVLGSLNRVSKKFAVESDDLIAAIRRAGGVFAISAGQFKEPITALNEFSAIFTAVRSTTRENAETIATGLRTIFSRLQRRGTIDMLQELGINLTDAKGKFIGLFESFKKLSTGLKGLVQEGDAITLSKITEELGGIRQIGKLIPAIKNFNKAEAAFKEAQRGATEGLGKDVAKGLTPLIVQFEKVRERFSALIRTISDSSTFQALAKSAIGIANAFLSVSESLTPIIPILTKLAAFKLAKGASSFFQGFFGSVGAGGGAGGVGGNLGRVATGQPKGGGGGAASGLAGSMKAMNTALGLLNKSTGLNTTALKNLTTAIGRLETKIGNINFGGGPRRGGARGPGARTRGFATGGLVPGQGNRDTVPAMLTPGEFVIRKSSVNSIGAGNLAGMNYSRGGKIPGVAYLNNGGDDFTPDRQAFANLNANQANSQAAAANKKKRKKAGQKRPRPLKLSTVSGRLGVVSVSDSSSGGTYSGSKIISPKEYSATEAKALGVRSDIPGQPLIGKMGKRDTLTTKFKYRGAGLKATSDAAFDQIIDESVANTITTVAQQIQGDLSLKGVGITIQQPPIISAISKALDVGDVGGKVFEGVVSGISGVALAQKAGARFDVPNPTKAQIDALNNFVSPKIAKNAQLLEIKKALTGDSVTSKSSPGSIFGKIRGAATGRDALDPTYADRLGLKVFAAGGAVGTDTVPAMLTPGEFVINRKSAQGIGYGNLKKMNTGGKLAGYAAGGIVQHFKKGGGVKGEGGGGLSNAAFIIPDLLFTLPMLTESFKQLNEGVEGAGAQFTSTLLSLGTSLLFIIPNLKGFGKNLRFGGGAREAFSKGFKRNKAQGGSFFDGIGRGLRGAAKGGSKKAGLTRLSVAGTGLTAAALGPAIAGGIGIALAGPISELVTGVQGLEKVAGFKGSRTESASQAAERGGLKGAIAGGSGGAALGFVLAGPVGAAVGGAVGGIGGKIIGEMEAAANKIRFDAVVGLNDASKKASEALIQLAKDTFVTAEDLTKANTQTSAFLNNLGTGGEFAKADSESVFGAENLQNIMVGLEATLGKGLPIGFITDFLDSSKLEGLSNEDEVNQRVGSRTGFSDFIERATGLNKLFGKGSKTKREVEGDIASGKIQRKGTDLFEKLKTFDPKLAKQSSEALANSLTSVTDIFIKASSNSTESIRKLQASLGSIDTTDPQKAVQGLETFIEALEGGDLGEAGKAAADTIKNDLALQLAAGTAEAIKGLDPKDSQAVSAQIQDVIAASQSDAPGAFSAALFKMNEELNAGNDNLKGAQRAFSRITKEAAKNTLATSQQATQQSIVNNLLEASNQLIDGLVSALQKLTGAMQQTSNTFDIFVSNTEKRIASLLSGQADFALDEVVNPFENLDLQGLESGGSNAAIENAFKEIASVGGTGATETLKGLQAAPGFAQALPDILKDSINEISDESEKKGDKLLTNKEMLDIIEKRAVASDPNLKGPLLDSFLKEMEKTLTQARQGTGGLDSVKAALGESGEVVEKFSGVVKEVIAETSEQFKISQEIAQRASDIAKVQRDVQKKYREFDIKRTEIDNRVGEITGERKGSLEQAQGDLNTQIARQTGQAVSIGGAVVAGGVATGNVAALQARQTALQTKKSQIEAARAVGGNSTNEVLISQLATVKSALEDTTGALNTLADDTTRLAAIESEIATLQSRQLAEQDALKGTFERLQGIQDKLNKGDFKGAAQDRKILRGEFGAVQKLETGQQLTTGEMLKLLNGTLDPILTAGGKTQEEIAKLKTQASGAARGATIDGLRQLGINFQGFQGVDQGAAIEAKKDQARQVGAQQKAAIDAMEQRVRTQTITEMNMLNTAVNELRVQMQLAAFSAAELRKVDDVQKKDVEDFLDGSGRDILEAGGGENRRIVSSTRSLGTSGRGPNGVAGTRGDTLIGGFVPASSNGNLADAAVRQQVDNEIGEEIKRLRNIQGGLIGPNREDNNEALIEEIDRLIQVQTDLGNIEEKAVAARDDQFKKDQQAAREAAKEAIKAREADLRTQRIGPAGVVAPVFTGKGPLSSIPQGPPSMNIPAIVQQLKEVGPLGTPTNLARGMSGFSNIEDRLSLGDKGRGGGNLGVEIDKLSKALVVLSSVDPDLLTVLGQISESTKTTADILTTEQGPNSFNVYDKTGDKNAGESSKKLAAIEQAAALPNAGDPLPAVPSFLISPEARAITEARGGNQAVNDAVARGRAQGFEDRKKNVKSATMKQFEQDMSPDKVFGAMVMDVGSVMGNISKGIYKKFKTGDAGMFKGTNLLDPTLEEKEGIVAEQFKSVDSQMLGFWENLLAQNLDIVASLGTTAVIKAPKIKTGAEFLKEAAEGIFDTGTRQKPPSFMRKNMQRGQVTLGGPQRGVATGAVPDKLMEVPTLRSSELAGVNKGNITTQMRGAGKFTSGQRPLSQFMPNQPTLSRPRAPVLASASDDAAAVARAAGDDAAAAAIDAENAAARSRATLNTDDAATVGRSDAGRMLLDADPATGIPFPIPTEILEQVGKTRARSPALGPVTDMSVKPSILQRVKSFFTKTPTKAEAPADLLETLAKQADEAAPRPSTVQRVKNFLSSNVDDAVGPARRGGRPAPNLVNTQLTPAGSIARAEDVRRASRTTKQVVAGGVVVGGGITAANSPTVRRTVGEAAAGILPANELVADPAAEAQVNADVDVAPAMVPPMAERFPDDGEGARIEFRPDAPQAPVIPPDAQPPAQPVAPVVPDARPNAQPPFLGPRPNLLPPNRPLVDADVARGKLDPADPRIGTMQEPNEFPGGFGAANAGQGLLTAEQAAAAATKPDIGFSQRREIPKGPLEKSNEQRVVDALNKQRTEENRFKRKPLTTSDLRKKSFFNSEGKAQPGGVTGTEIEGNAMGIQGDRMSKANVAAAIENRRQAAIKAKEDKDEKDLQARQANAAAIDPVSGKTNAELARKRYADRQGRKKEALRQVRSGKLKPNNVQDFLNQKGAFTPRGSSSQTVLKEVLPRTWSVDHKLPNRTSWYGWSLLC